MAPAGDWEALRAAVANGADSVYFGLSNFSARHRATNFTLEELPTVMDYLHSHNVRGYIAFNTLIFSDELEGAAEHLLAAMATGGRRCRHRSGTSASSNSSGRLAPHLAIHGPRK